MQKVDMLDVKTSPFQEEEVREFFIALLLDHIVYCIFSHAAFVFYVFLSMNALIIDER